MNRLAPILFATLFTACAAEEPRTEITLEPWVLAHNTTMFAYVPVGYAGQHTDEYLRVKEIAETDDAEEQFLVYLESDDPGIRLYGMLGLFLINSPEYPATIEMLLKDDSHVKVGSGCLIGTSTTSEVASGFDAFWSFQRQRAEASE